MLEKSFGTRSPDKTYIERVGAYGIIFNSEQQIAVTYTSSGYYLLGGKIENGESHEDCIKRECLEEVGLSVSVGDFICKGDNYFWSIGSRQNRHGIGYFYYAYPLTNHLDLQTEEDNQLMWLEAEECLKKLYLEHQSWAVKQAVSLYGKTHSG